MCIAGQAPHMPYPVILQVPEVLWASIRKLTFGRLGASLLRSCAVNRRQRSKRSNVLMCGYSGYAPLHMIENGLMKSE